MSVSSTVAVMMNNDIDHAGCCDNSPTYQPEDCEVLISDNDEESEDNCDKNDGSQPNYHHLEQDYNAEEEDEIEDGCH